LLKAKAIGSTPAAVNAAARKMDGAERLRTPVPAPAVPAGAGGGAGAAAAPPAALVAALGGVVVTAVAGDEPSAGVVPLAIVEMVLLRTGSGVSGALGAEGISPSLRLRRAVAALAPPPPRAEDCRRLRLKIGVPLNSRACCDKSPCNPERLRPARATLNIAANLLAFTDRRNDSNSYRKKWICCAGRLSSCGAPSRANC
jgi:hypothetical protein